MDADLDTLCMSATRGAGSRTPRWSRSASPKRSWVSPAIAGSSRSRASGSAISSRSCLAEPACAGRASSAPLTDRGRPRRWPMSWGCGASPSKWTTSRRSTSWPPTLRPDRRHRPVRADLEHGVRARTGGDHRGPGSADRVIRAPPARAPSLPLPPGSATPTLLWGGPDKGGSRPFLARAIVRHVQKVPRREALVGDQEATVAALRSRIPLFAGTLYKGEATSRSTRSRSSGRERPLAPMQT